MKIVHSNQSDIELIKQVQSGDDRAFEEIVNRYESRVAATVIGMLGYCPEADDVGQETFVRFYKSISQFRGDSSLATYITRIAINLSLNELKKRKRKRGLFTFFQKEDERYSEMSDATMDPNIKDTHDMVHKGIQQLKPEHRAVILLRMIEGYTTKETAEVLNIPLGTVLSRLARAQEKLKDILSKMGYNE